jgi:hypothetical protein
MTRSWRPDGDPSPAQLVGGVWSRCAAWDRAVEPAQQGRSSRVALGSRPLRSGSGSGSEWRSRLVPALFHYAPLAQASSPSTVVNVRSHSAAGSTRISSNASYLMEPATRSRQECLSQSGTLQVVADGTLRAVPRPQVPLEGAEQRAGRGAAVHGAEVAQLGVLHPLCGPSGRPRTRRRPALPLVIRVGWR